MADERLRELERRAAADPSLRPLIHAERARLGLPLMPDQTDSWTMQGGMQGEDARYFFPNGWVVGVETQPLATLREDQKRPWRIEITVMRQGGMYQTRSPFGGVVIKKKTFHAPPDPWLLPQVQGLLLKAMELPGQNPKFETWGVFDASDLSSGPKFGFWDSSAAQESAEDLNRKAGYERYSVKPHTVKRNMDARLRDLERRARAGDPRARAELTAMQARAGDQGARLVAALGQLGLHAEIMGEVEGLVLGDSWIWIPWFKPSEPGSAHSTFWSLAIFPPWTGDNGPEWAGEWLRRGCGQKWQRAGTWLGTAGDGYRFQSLMGDSMPKTGEAEEMAGWIERYLTSHSAGRPAAEAQWAGMPRPGRGRL